MCRFLVYKGSDDILLSKLIVEPTHSILHQSFDSRLRLDTRRGKNNADGFGIGFYTDAKLGAAPCLFTSTIPAWNCKNLTRLASKTASHLIFAHVRATTEGSLSEDNCHPFCHGSLMWMHNGGIGGWHFVKRRLGDRLADKWFHIVKGGTDSEWAFALFLDTLERMGHDPSSQLADGFGPVVLRKAMLQTIYLTNELVDAIPDSVVMEEGVDTRSLLNFAVSDGHSVICTRYVSSSEDEAASLYYSSGSMWQKLRSGSKLTHAPDATENYQMERSDKGADVVLVASEPLTFERENWVNVPTNSILTIHKQTVMVHPIKDQYFQRNPYYRRSAAYVGTKGLIANEKLPTRETTPAPSPGLRELDSHQRFPSLPSNLPGHSNHIIPSFAPVPTMPHARSTLSHSDPIPSAMSAPTAMQPISDVRAITDLPDTSQTPRSPPPVQGNIKKKRATLPAAFTETEALWTGDSDGGGHNGNDVAEAQSPGEGAVTSPNMTNQSAPRTEFGNPAKIGKFFPELMLP